MFIGCASQWLPPIAVEIIVSLRERDLEFTADRNQCQHKFVRKRVWFLTIAI